MKNNKFPKSLQILMKELISIQVLLEGIQNKLNDSNHLTEFQLKRLKGKTIAIVALIKEVKKVKSLTLMEQDYVNFCLLLAYGSDMADDLLELENSSDKSRSNAHSWNAIVKEFVPFVSGSFYNTTILKGLYE